MPDWLPNAHPLVVHFPIALLIAAVLVDLVGLFLRRYPGIQRVAVGLYVAGAIGTVAAYVTGLQAVEAVDIPAQAMSAMASHEDWAFYTLLFYGVYAVVRGSIAYVRPKVGLVPHLLLVLIGAFGLWPLLQTGDRGGELVFTHGVGVQAVDRLQAELEERRAAERIAQAAPVEEEDGSWSWHVTEGSDEALAESFEWLRGSADEVEMGVTSENGESVLSLTLQNGEALFVYGEDVASAEVRGQLNLDNFDGSVALVHNVTGPEEFHYLRYDGQEMVQGRRLNGSDDTLDEGSIQGSAMVRLRATGDAGHFYGYVNGETVTHGHSSPPEAGRIGLLIEGTGTLLIQRLEVEVIE